MSGDGRFVVFESEASNLVADDANGVSDVFLADTCVGAPTGCTPLITRVGVGSGGTEGNGASAGASLSADRRFVAFAAHASNLVANDTNGMEDIFVRDTCQSASGCTPRTIRVSLASDNSQANADSTQCAISADGRYVAYASKATNLVSPPPSGVGDVFLARVQWP